MADPTFDVLTCKECGTTLPEKRDGRGANHTYCSLSCKRRGQRGSQNHRLDCQRCSTSFTTRNPDAKYCSAICREPSISKRCSLDGCGQPLRARGLCAKHWKQQYGKRTMYAITCTVCEMEHQSTRPDGKYCSDACKSARLSERGAGPHCKIPITHRAHPYWIGRLLPAVRTKPALWLRTPAVAQVPRARRWYVGQCQRCDTWFVFDQPANRYCSTRCGKRDAKDRRRATKKEAFVAPVYRARIFDRDGWRCQLCGKATKRHEVVPHPLAPVIDHVVPLAKGGTHEPANAQCAHFMCNSVKSDRGEPQQLMLIG